LISDDYNLFTMEKFKKWLYLIAGIIGLLLFAGVKELNKPARKQKVNELTNKILGEENTVPKSSYYTIGSSSLKLKSPYPLIKSSVPFPDNMKSQVEVIEVYEFTQNTYFEGKVSYIKWNSSVSYNLEVGAAGTINNVRALTGVEKVIDNKVYFENAKYQAYFIDAIMIRNSQSAIIKGAIFKCGQETWLINLALTDTKNEKIIDEILASLKENE
jgi:hypothetical protein